MAGTMSFIQSRIAASNMRIVNKSLLKNAARASKGEKIVGASDGASSYAISEKMRVLIRSLSQCSDNAKTATSMISTAESSLQNSLEILRKMKTLTIEGANGIWTDKDYETMDKEFQQSLEQIDTIASTTTYNGIQLLDGTWARRFEEEASVTPQAQEEVALMALSAEPVALAASSISYKVDITQDGVYTMPAGFTGEINITAKNVYLKQATADQLTNVTINCAAGTNLVIDNLNITNTHAVNTPTSASADSSIINFTGTGNHLTLVGMNTLTASYESTSTTIGLCAASIVHVGTGTELTINEAAGGGTLYMETIYTRSFPLGQILMDSSGAVLGGNSGEGCGTITINGGSVIAKNGFGSNGAGIGGGVSGGKVGDIIINGGYVEAHAEDGSAIGGHGGFNSITINGGEVRAYIDGGYTNYGTAVGCYSGTVGSITLNGGELYAVLAETKTISNRASAGYLDPNQKLFTITPTVKSGAVYETYYDPGKLPDNGTRPTGSTEHIAHFYYDWTQPDPDVIPSLPDQDWDGIPPVPMPDPVPDPEPDPEPDPDVPVPDTGRREWHSLRYQLDPHASQFTTCYINDMRVEALGLSGLHLSSRQAAEDLLSNDKAGTVGALDAALESVLGEITRLGAYQARFKEADANITVVHENATNAESVIRDADMAKTMTEYARDSIVAQASQSMLAQANQDSYNVLSLLQ